MTKLPCGIVRDLLPGYIDKLTGKETNTAVEEHLRNCQECAKISDHMREPEPFPAEEDPRQIDYLKKIKKRSQRILIAAIVGTTLIFALGLGVRTFLIGVEQEADGIFINTRISSAQGQPVLTVELESQESGKTLLTNCVTEGEMTVILLKSVHSSPLHPEEPIEITVPLCIDTAKNGQTRYIYVANRLIYENGTEITKKAQAAYEARTSYIGNISAAGKVSQALELPILLGNWQNSLQTDEEPYGWSFWFSDFYTDYDAEYLNRTMRTNSFLLMALIDNLGQVSWHYNGTDNQSHMETITLKEADQELRRLLAKQPNAFGSSPPESIKECSRSAAEIQRLMNLLQI